MITEGKVWEIVIKYYRLVVDFNIQIQTSQV